MTIKIRQAQPKELKEIISLRLTLLKRYPQAFLATYEEEVNKSFEEWKDWFASLRKERNSNLFVGEDKNALVGMVICRGGRHKRAEHIATVDFLGVSPSYQGRGLGKVLMKKLINWTKRRTSICRLQLVVYADNKKALSLYRKLGFKKEGVFPRYAKTKEGGYQTGILMALYL